MVWSCGVTTFRVRNRLSRYTAVLVHFDRDATVVLRHKHKPGEKHCNTEHNGPMRANNDFRVRGQTFAAGSKLCLHLICV